MKKTFLFCILVFIALWAFANEPVYEIKVHQPVVTIEQGSDVIVGVELTGYDSKIQRIVKWKVEQKGSPVNRGLVIYASGVQKSLKIIAAKEGIYTLTARYQDAEGIIKVVVVKKGELEKSKNDLNTTVERPENKTLDATKLFH